LRKNYINPLSDSQSSPGGVVWPIICDCQNQLTYLLITDLAWLEFKNKTLRKNFISLSDYTELWKISARALLF